MADMSANPPISPPSATHPGADPLLSGEPEVPVGQAPAGAGKSFYPALVIWTLWMAFLIGMMFLRIQSTLH